MQTRTVGGAAAPMDIHTLMSQVLSSIHTTQFSCASFAKETYKRNDILQKRPIF